VSQSAEVKSQEVICPKKLDRRLKSSHTQFNRIRSPTPSCISTFEAWQTQPQQQHQQDQREVDLVDEAEAATEAAEAVAVVDEGQNGTKRRNGSLSQNLAVLCAPEKSSRWRYVFNTIIVAEGLTCAGNLLAFSAHQGIPDCRLFPPQAQG
jgi:hypothetical protein